MPLFLQNALRFFSLSMYFFFVLGKGGGGVSDGILLSLRFLNGV